MENKSQLMIVPREIRDQIYGYLLTCPTPIALDPKVRTIYKEEPIACRRRNQILYPQIASTCRQIHSEAYEILYGKNTYSLDSDDELSAWKLQPSSAWSRDPRIRAMRLLDLNIVIENGLDGFGLDIMESLAELPELQRLNIRYHCNIWFWRVGLNSAEKFLKWPGLVADLNLREYLTTVLLMLRNVHFLTFNGIAYAKEGFNGTPRTIPFTVRCEHRQCHKASKQGHGVSEQECEFYYLCKAMEPFPQVIGWKCVSTMSATEPGQEVEY